MDGLLHHVAEQPAGGEHAVVVGEQLPYEMVCHDEGRFDARSGRWPLRFMQVGGEPPLATYAKTEKALGLSIEDQRMVRIPYSLVRRERSGGNRRWWIRASPRARDRKSTRLNSSHHSISYA